MLFLFLPAWNPASWGWERALKQDAALAVSSSISHYREFWGWQGAITHTGKMPLAIASPGTALLIGSSLAWRDCNLVPSCEAKTYMCTADGLTFSMQCLGHVLHTQQYRVLVASFAMFTWDFATSADFCEKGAQTWWWLKETKSKIPFPSPSEIINMEFWLQTLWSDLCWLLFLMCRHLSSKNRKPHCVGGVFKQYSLEYKYYYYLN